MNNPPADPTAYVEVLARLLCAADVHVHGDDHPTWQQLVGEPGQSIRDDYRKAAGWLASRLTVTPPPAVSEDTTTTRADVLREAATIVRSMDSDYALQEAAEHLDGLAVEVDEEREARRLAAETQPSEPPRPQRGDAVETWLKAQRDEYHQTTSPQWIALDEVLDTYRLHADMGEPLDGHVCEGRVVGDCDCLEQPAASAGVQTDEETSR